MKAMKDNISSRTFLKSELWNPNYSKEACAETPSILVSAILEDLENGISGEVDM